MTVCNSLFVGRESGMRRVGGVILLREDGAALLQLRDSKPGLNAAGQWVFPGGHADVGEDMEQCARREFEEETGYICRNLHWLLTIKDGFGPWEPYELSLFWELVDKSQTTDCREGQALEFISPDDAKKLPVPHYQQLIWELALINLKSQSTQAPPPLEK